MQNETLESSSLSIFALITFFVFLITSKYSHKIKKGILLDQDFSKPQAFHLLPVTRSGGLAVIISLNIFFIIFNLMYSKILFEYLFIIKKIKNVINANTDKKLDSNDSLCIY